MIARTLKALVTRFAPLLVGSIVLGTVGGYAAHRYFAKQSCCTPGSSCCYPGSPCCHHAERDRS
jgi:hypothetical protein